MWSVRWYCRYALSYADIREMALERGLEVERSTLYRWVQEFGPQLAERVKPYLKITSPSWRLNETYLRIKGKWHYLYRAIDKEGQMLDWMLSRHRNKKAAKRFFKKMLSSTHVKMPRVINVDKNPAFPPAFSELKSGGDFVVSTKLRRIKCLNNSIENDHKSIKRKSRYRQWYQSFKTARRTIDGLETMRMIQKGQIRYAVKNDILAQNKFIHRLFRLHI